MIRVAVTGASGDVGSALVHALAESEEIRAVAIVRNTLAPALLDRPDIEVRVGSITDPASAQSLMNDCDAIVNCAVARGNPRQSRLQNRSIVENISAVDPVSRV
ncbi:MAG: NAD(P)H-binding protein, partial [SAR202 cluster bacterium]|nr:NAD(P)H-binding protein [SAR202 cluster bacterium]